MTIKQKQLILCWFDLLNPEDVDGIWGNKSEEATRRLQKGLGITEDGVFGQNTAGEALNQMLSGEPLQVDADRNVPAAGTFWEEIEFFTEEEFKCKCGGRYCNGYPARMQEQVVRICDAARRHFGRPGHVISGLRCPTHNANEGGVSDSQHMYGEAVDLQIEGVGSDALMAFIQTQPHRYTYKINGTNVHVDIPKGAR